MGPEDHKAILRDENKNVVERLRAAAKLELILWESRSDPPNLSRAEFEKLLPFVPFVDPKWAPRESSEGKYGLTGEDSVFSFEFQVSMGRKVSVYYLKGFFFEKTDLKGVEIQSFRLVRRLEKGRAGLRLLR